VQVVVPVFRLRKSQVALLLETFSLATFFEINQRKLSAPQRGNLHLNQHSQ
jgi:hypothetical protein